jgi:hypothetical protein
MTAKNISSTAINSVSLATFELPGLTESPSTVQVSCTQNQRRVGAARRSFVL